MKQHLLLLTLVGVLSLPLVSADANAQGRGRGMGMGAMMGRGVCDGRGPKGNGPRIACLNPGADCATCPYYGQSRSRCPNRTSGQAWGCGNGLRLRDGSGPNPNCLLKKN